MDCVAETEVSSESGGPLLILMRPGVTTDSTAINAQPSHVIISTLDPTTSVANYIDEGESLPELQPTLVLDATEQALVQPALAEQVLDEQSLADHTLMVTTAEEEALSSLLNSVPLGADTLGAEQRITLFQADDGQIVCLTYSMEGEDETDVDGADLRTDEREVLDDNPLQSRPQNACVSSPDGSQLPSDVVWMDGGATTMSISNETLSKLRLEDRLRVLEQLLPPAPRIRQLPELRKLQTQSSTRASTPRSKAARPAAPRRLTPSPASARPSDPGGGGPGGGSSSGSSKGGSRVYSKGGTSGGSIGGSTDGSNGGSSGESGSGTKALYACDMCGACFERPAQFYGHLHRHSGERKFQCTLCGNLGESEVEFDTAAALRAHVHRHHPLQRPHACEVCGERFDRASQRDYHTRRVHVGERPHRCALCSKAFFKRSDLRTHLNVHLGIHSCVCETCGRRFSHVSNLIRHSRTHAGSRPYPCPVCGRRFAQVNAAMQHRAAAHPEHGEEGGVAADGDAAQVGGSVIPREFAPRVPCAVSECARTFRTFNVMRKHARSAHGVLVPTAAQRRLQDALATNPLAGQMPMQRKRRFHCAACGAAFTQAAQLREHERAHELAAGSEGLTCSGCAQRYSTVEELRTHPCAQPPERLQTPSFAFSRVPQDQALQATNTTSLPLPPPLMRFLALPSTAPDHISSKHSSQMAHKLVEKQKEREEALEVEVNPVMVSQVQDGTEDQEVTLDDSHNLLESLLMEASQNDPLPRPQTQTTSHSSVAPIHPQERLLINCQKEQPQCVQLSVQPHSDALVQPTAQQPPTDTQPALAVAMDQTSAHPLPVSVPQPSSAMSDGAVGTGLSNDQSFMVLLTTTTDVESGVNSRGANAVPLLLIRPRTDRSLPSTPLPTSSAEVTTGPVSKSAPGPAAKLAPKSTSSPLPILATASSVKTAPTAHQTRSRPRPRPRARPKLAVPEGSQQAPPPPPPPLKMPAPSQPAQPTESATSRALVPQKPGLRSFVCGECGKIFLKSHNYKQHMGMHFVDQMRHACTICGRMFAWKSTLNKHMARAHGIGAPARARCGRCGREYSSPAQVAEHERRDHQMLRPHACSAPGCTRRFYKKHDLKVHQRMHSQERPYICGSCGKSFCHLSHIIRHERIHSGHRPYACNDCGKQFNQLGSLKNHKKTHQEKKHRQLELQKKQELNEQQLSIQKKTGQIVEFSASLEDHQAEKRQLNVTPLVEAELETQLEEEGLEVAVLEERALEVASLEERELNVGSLHNNELEPLHVEIEQCDALETVKGDSSLLPSPSLTRGTPPEPLVELTVSDADMVLGLTPSIFPPGLFPDVS